MKKILLILLISLLGTTSSFSQTTYPKVTKDSLVVITPQQLKQTNLIFTQHDKYKQLIPSYEYKIILKDSIITALKEVIVIKDTELFNKDLINENNTKIIQLQKKELATYKKNYISWKIGSISVAAILTILLITK